MAGIALLAFLFEVIYVRMFSSSQLCILNTSYYLCLCHNTDGVFLTGIDRRSPSFGRSDSCFGSSTKQRYELGHLNMKNVNKLHVSQTPLLSLLCSGSSTVIPNFRLSDIIPSAKELHSYYRYVGSMTTPGCEQAVAWTVFHRTLPISSRQVSSCRQNAQGQHFARKTKWSHYASS